MAECRGVIDTFLVKHPSARPAPTRRRATFFA